VEVRARGEPRYKQEQAITRAQMPLKAMFAVSTLDT
jgi:hypothetical protein